MQKIKVFLFAFLLSFFFGTSLAAYQQQGFTTFQENGSTVTFSCEKQCFILLGAVGTNEMISLQGSTQGGGQLGYGFLVADKIYPGEIIAGQGGIDETFVFSNTQVFSQIPKEQTQIVVLVNGALQSSGLTIDYGKLFFSEKVQFGWNDFWINEPLRPYSINLRYGVKILGTPLLQYFYWIFIIGAIIIIFSIKRKETKMHYLLIFGIVLILLFSLRNLRNRTDWTSTGMHTYSNQPEAQKSFFDLGDYPVFISKMREKLDLDNQFGKISCTIYFDAFQEWPFKVHADTVYIKPCEPAKDKASADYIVFYKKAVDPEFATKEVLLDRNGSFLIHNKK